MLRRVRHVVTEDERVERFVSLLKQGGLAGHRLADAGKLLTASHASLRDRLQVSVPALDRLVDLAMASIVVALPFVLPLVYFMMKRLSK